MIIRKLGYEPKWLVEQIIKDLRETKPNMRFYYNARLHAIVGEAKEVNYEDKNQNLYRR